MKDVIFGLIVMGKIKVKVESVQQEPNTYIKLTVKMTGRRGYFDVVGHGFARHNQIDKDSKSWGWDPAIGRALAAARAAEDLARKLAKEDCNFMTKWKELKVGR